MCLFFTVIENMCCQGYTIGGKFEELKEIIDRIHDKTRIGICLDTCHMFAAGKDSFSRFYVDFTIHYLLAI